MILDYLQFSIPLESPFVAYLGHANDERPVLSMLLESLLLAPLGAKTQAALRGLDSETPVKALAPYNSAFAFGLRQSGQSTLITVMYNRSSPSVDTMLVQVSGQGCAWLDAQGILADVVTAFLGRIGRVDFAFDFACDYQPEDAFTTERRTSILRSNTGTTIYAGSPKSDRYARVYRYAAPHPRADRLRFEFVFKSKPQAKAALETWLYKYTDFSTFCTAFGLQPVPSLAEGEGEGEALAPVPRNPSSSEASTTLWLIQAAAPAFRRLVAQGAIKDAEAFLNQYFLNG